MTKEEQTQQLLKKYLEQKASPAEIKQVESWYASYEQQPASLTEERKAEIGKSIFGNLRQHMEETPETKVLRFSGALKWAKIAAAIAMVSGLGLTIWSMSRTTAIPENLIAISTAANENKKITLADGSEILLSPSARLLYPAKFKVGSRTIELAEGEAFFKIAHDEHRPFTVKMANGLYTKVLGTSFTIKSYRTSPSIKISVATGKVAVGNAHQVFGTLIKGQEINYDKKEQRAAIVYTPAPVYVNLVFEGTTLGEVVSKLQYAYNIQINLSSPSLNKLKCSATFNTRQSLEEILELICSLHHLKFKPTTDHKTFNVYKR